jgi:hypothetical protein
VPQRRRSNDFESEQSPGNHSKSADWESLGEAEKMIEVDEQHDFNPAEKHATGSLF